MPVAFDAVGGGLANSNFPNETRQWTHTIPTGNGVVVVLSLNFSSGAQARTWVSNTPTQVTWGSTPMTLYAVQANNNVATAASGSSFAWTALYYLLNPASRGTQTVTIGMPTGPGLRVWGNSVSYTGVSRLNGPYYGYGLSTSQSLAIPSGSGQMVVGGVGVLNQTVTVTSGTSRYAQSTLGANPSNNSGYILDSPWSSGTSVTLSTTSSGSEAWSFIGINLAAFVEGGAAATATATTTAGITRKVSAGAALNVTAGDPWQLGNFQGLFFAYDLNGLPWTPNVVSAGYGVAASTVVTAARSASISKIANAQAAATATATFLVSQNRIVPVSASTTTATATFSASGGRGQFLSANLSTTAATGTPQTLYAAGMFSSLFVNSLQAATGLRTVIGIANLTSTAARSAAITSFGVLNASITATAARTANLVSNQRISSGITGTAAASGFLSRGQSIASVGVTATGARTGALSYGASAGANLISTALFASSIVKIRLLSGSLTVTASTSAGMVENTVAQATLAATATPAAALTKRLNAAASITAIATPSGSMIATRGIQAALTVVAFRDGMIDEPREILYVESDNRKATVELDDDRKAYINKYDRYASVPPYSDRTATVETTEVSKAISRDPLEGFRGSFFWFVELPMIRSSSRSYQIGDDDRFVSVDAEDRDALVPATRPESLLK